MELRAKAVQQLKRQLRRIEHGSESDRHKSDFMSTGVAALDELLPERGVRRGTIIEWLSIGEGSGCGTFLFMVAAQLTRRSGTLVVIDQHREFYPPAAANLGIDLDRTVVVRPDNALDTIWTLEQSLQCPSVRATVCCVDSLNDRVFRRLQLAVEIGKSIGFLMRSAKFRSQPSWAEVRLLVQSLPLITAIPSQARRMRIELLHCRSRTGGGAIDLEICDETGLVRLVAKVAGAKNPSRAAGA